MIFNIPRIVISALSGGSGKTMISVGLTRALARRGYRVQTFKKGPDYIDTLWAALAGGLPPRNLDPYMNGDASLACLFAAACRNTGASFHLANKTAWPVNALPDIAIIEGNRGLFDGMDLNGSCSTAELARQLAAPVLLTVNCSKMTRTTAALVKGCKDFEVGVNVAGVILNQASRERHREIVRRAVEELAGVPVFGAIPRLAREPFEERHNGLLGEEAVLGGSAAFSRLDELADIIEANVDLDGVIALAASAPELEIPEGDLSRPEGVCEGVLGSASKDVPDGALAKVSGCASEVMSGNAKPRIGYVRDAAFWFYYTENLEALERAGAELVPVSLLESGNDCGAQGLGNLEHLDEPDNYNRAAVSAGPEGFAGLAGLIGLAGLDGLYIGGGFPEDYAGRLSDNSERRTQLASLIEAGMPVYAEGSAIYYLARELTCGGRSYPMCGIFDFAAELGKKPRGIGYVRAVVERENPFHPAGCGIKGHEFHYASLKLPAEAYAGTLLRMEKGTGLGAGVATAVGDDATVGGASAVGICSRDGLLYKNCYASHMQIFAPGTPHWAVRFVNAARRFAADRSAR